MKCSFSFKRAARFSLTEYSRWVGNPRTILILIEVIFIWSFAVEPLKTIIAAMNYPLNAAEPILAVFNSKALSLVIPTVFFVLIADIPLTGNEDLFFIHRISKKEWLIGQILFCFFAAISYLTVITLITILPLVNNIYVNNEWSPAITRYAAYYPDRASSFEADLISSRLYSQISPLNAGVHSVLLNALFIISIPLMLLLFYTCRARKAGNAFVAALIGTGAALCAADVPAMWGFPSAHTLLYLHFNSYIRKVNMEIGSSYLYFAILDIALVAVLFIRLNKTDMLRTEEG